MKNFLKAMIQKNGGFSKTAVMLWLVLINGLILMNLTAASKIQTFPESAVVILAGVAGGTYAIANSKKLMG